MPKKRIKTFVQRTDTTDEQKAQKPLSIKRKRQRVADNLKQLRVEKGFSQQKLARLAEVNRSHLARFESQGINISLNILLRLTNALGVCPSVLFER